MPASDPGMPDSAASALASGNAPDVAVQASGHSVAAMRIDKLHYYAAATEVAWPLRVGAIPLLASAFQARSGLRAKVEVARAQGAGVVLTQVLSGGGGVGKSQLAASYADLALAAGTDLVVWVNATTAGQVVVAYAQAAARAKVPGAHGQNAHDDARVFLDWLSATRRSWLLVLDDIVEPAEISSWWPASHTRTGWVLATTRRRDAAMSGGGRVLVDVDVYTPTESAAYLNDRLSGARKGELLDDEVERLARELGDLPLALSHAAAYMIKEGVSCGQYLELFSSNRSRLAQIMPADADTEGYGRRVALTLLVGLDAAEACEPVGLATAAIRLAAVLEPAGHPESLWVDSEVTGYLTAHRTHLGSAAYSGRTTEPDVEPDETPVTAEDARAVLRLLNRYGLVSHDQGSRVRAIRIHALTARVVRENTPAAEVSDIVKAAADALLADWPESDHTSPGLSAGLRANATVLARHGGDLLWQANGHPVLYRAGNSLLAAGLHFAAVDHWQQIAADSERILGAEHPDALSARSYLALSYQAAGHTAEAIALQEEVAADSERVLGGEHSVTLSARRYLGGSYQEAGRTVEAIAIKEQVAADSERILGGEHPLTLDARATLAASYWQAGRTADAIFLLERVAADSERILGAEHLETLSARGDLAASYKQAGRTDEAIALLEQVVTDSERILGAEHPETLGDRGNLAVSYMQAGRTADAIALLVQVAAATVRILGPEHAHTLTTQGNLAVAYMQAGRTDEAITLQEQVAADSRRIPDGQ